MANIFKRLFRIGEAEAHTALDKLEDPIKMTEQGIRDMKKDLDTSLHSLAEIKAMAIRTRNENSNNQNKAKDYEEKAMLLLKKAGNGDLDPIEADRLATEALTKKKECDDHSARNKVEQEKLDKSVSKLEGNVKSLRSNISQWENELKTLKARAKVSSATTKMNKQLANIDSSSTIGMLERMKEKVEQEEALAESYGDIADESKSVDSEIDKALNSGSSQASDDLEALKAKMGLDKK